MDELSVSCIDAHMGDAAGICIGEENNIAHFQVFLGNSGAVGVLVSRGSVGRETQLLEYIVNEAGAVKTGGGSAAEIGRAHV